MKQNGLLKTEIPAQGWIQFLTARKKMLDSFDIAKSQSSQHIVQTSHGNVAEAEFRNWLSDFLPKKYAVTSGYIISSGVSSDEKSPHFDIIIYEYLEAPVLWVEKSPDNSQQGCSLAIPAEYVKGVIEVKSAFKNSNVKEAIKHLEELKNLMSGIDATEERYKMYLPPDFFCGIAFFELRKENEMDKQVLSTFLKGIDLRGFVGGVILRGEGHSKPATGRIELLQSKTDMSKVTEKPNWSLLSKIKLANKSVKINDSLYYGASLMWEEWNFSRYAFDLVAMLNGHYDCRRLSSFHAIGSSEFGNQITKRKGENGTE